MIDLQFCEAVCSAAPIIIMMLPKRIAHLRPIRSVTKGTKGSEQIEPREYRAERSPRIVDLGWLKTRAGSG